jgi:threonine/homoserine/homoserine lactone efflux protein
LNPTVNLILQGALLGLGLAIMVGPIFIALMQTSIEKGGRAGLMVGLGIWVSDVLFVTVAYYFIHKISHIVNDATFTFWMGLLGGFILIVFGISAMVKQVDVVIDRPSFSAKSLFNYWSKGFLVNTVNPFTFIFWISVISTYVIRQKVTPYEAGVFLTSIIVVIIITDALKVILAKSIRKRLDEKLISLLIKGAGLVLLLFGIALIVRTS